MRAAAFLLVGLVVAGCAGAGSRKPAQEAAERPALETPVPPAPAPAPMPPTGPPVAPQEGPIPNDVAQGARPRAAQAPPLGQPAPPASAPRPRAARQIVLNFDAADIEAVIHAASEIAGFNYTLGPGVAGKKVTVQTSGRIPEDEVFNVLLAVLEVNGVTAIRSGNLYKIVPMTTARERPVPTVIGAQPDASRRDDEVITQIVPIQHASAERVAAALRSFVQGGNVLVQGNLLVVTDTAANIARLLQIVAVLDVETALDELRLVAVRYADAADLARILNEFFSGRRARTAAAPVTPLPVTPRPGAPAAAATAPGVEPSDRPPLILSDKRTNSLIVSARRGDLDLITRLIGQLDVDTQANKRVFVYYVENVKAKELAVTLTEIFGKPEREVVAAVRRDAGEPVTPTPSTTARPQATAVAAVSGTTSDLEASVVEGQVKVIADEPNNALIITTFPRNWPLIEDTVRKLDRTPKQVLIEVLVAELALTDDMRLGLEWTLRTQRDVKVGGNTYNIGSFTRLDAGPPSTLPGQTPTPTLPAIAPVATPATAGLSFLIFETDRFLSLLNLYASYGQLSVLSSPTILTSENKKAVINVSDSIPIVTQQVVSQTGTVTTVTQQAPTNVLTQNVEYRDAGIVLTVTPRISDKRVVAIDVKQTVNNVGPPQPPSGSPIIIKREAETSVVLRDNQTLVLGGLIQTRRSNTQSGIPWLSKIPVVGFLFGVTGEEVERTELLLLITPRVIGDPSEAQEVYQQVRSQRPGLERGLRSHPSIIRPERAMPAPPVPAPAPAPSLAPPPFPGGYYSDR